MTEKISIIVPIYNVEPYLRQCLNSIVNQTYRNLEILLIDDGSPDHCGAICDEYASRDCRITVIHKKNAGVSAARNDGIEAATGEWILFVDPDDWLELDCCTQILSVAAQAQCDVICFQREENGEANSLVRRFPHIGSFELSKDDLRKVQLDVLAGYHEPFGFEGATSWGKLFRRKFLLNSNCHFPIGIRKCQDIIFNLYWLDWLDHMYFYDYVGYHYRNNENSVCRKYNPEILSILLSVLYQADEFVRGRHADEDVYKQMLGAMTYNILTDFDNLFLFHREHIMAFKEYAKNMQLYYDDSVVKEYMKKCSLFDMHTLKTKVRFILLSKKHFLLYYCIRSVFSRLRRR